MKRNRILRIAAAGCLLAGALLGQTAPPGPLTLKQAIETAGANYPSIRASLAEVSAAESEISLAATAYLPSADLLLHFNRATRNNIHGLVLPNSVLPSVSGPVQNDVSGQSTFGSAVGALFSWEPIDFGLRKARVGVAKALKRKAEAGTAVTRFEVSLAAAEAFLSAVGYREATRAAQANVERMEVFARTVKVFVENELRPGVDSSRAEAELARARNDLIRVEQQEAQARARLAEWLGMAGRSIEIQPASLLSTPPADAGASLGLEEHPFAGAQDARIELVRARRLALSKQWRPKFELQGAAYGRGSGAKVDGTFRGGGSGLAPNVGNWALGFNLSFDLFDYQEIRAKQQIETRLEEAATARREQVLEGLRGRAARARIAVEAARKIAANTPLGLASARDLERQARVRYQVGLGDVLEAADAERLLRQAETDDSLARLDVWRALFALAAAEGDMDALLAASSR